MNRSMLTLQPAVAVLIAFMAVAATFASGQTFTVLHNFPSTLHDASFIYSRLKADSAGNLYGTSNNGGNFGVFGFGTVYQLLATGGEQLLYSFTGRLDGGAPI